MLSQVAKKEDLMTSLSSAFA